MGTANQLQYPLAFGSLFAGIGGIDLGLERAGMVCKWQVEIDPFCQRIVAKHWPDVKRYGDIKQLTGKELAPVDVVCGGFPCQDLSVAGKQVGIEGSRSGLWFEYARLIGELRPRYVLIENVSGLLVYNAMRRVVGELARLGYVGVWRSFRASDFGASHLRKRVFIVAHSSEGVSSGINTTARNGREDSQRRSGELAHAEYGGVYNRPRTQGWEAGERPPERSGSRNSGGDVAHANGRQCEQRRGSEPHQRDVERRLCGSDCSSGPLGHARSSRRSRPEDAGTDSGDAGEVRSRSAEPERRRCDVADASNGQLQEPGWGPEGRDGIGSASESLPVFAPGPSDTRWAAILTECPYLAPSLEPPVRGVVDGVPEWLDRSMSNRTKRLSKLGNAVVPQIAEWVGRRILTADSTVLEHSEIRSEN